jgi:hypothetical protein
MKLFTPKVLGIIGIIGAPWIFIDFIDNGLYDRFSTTTVSGVRNFVFMTGWICSVIGLYQLKAMGTKRWQKIVMIFQLVMLGLADAWCIWEILTPGSPSKLSDLLNLAWPIGGCFMLFTGIVIARANKLKGWKRYTPLLAGLWFPQTVVMAACNWISLPVLIASGIYSAVAFSLLGISLILTDDKVPVRK